MSAVHIIMTIFITKMNCKKYKFHMKNFVTIIHFTCAFWPHMIFEIVIHTLYSQYLSMNRILSNFFCSLVGVKGLSNASSHKAYVARRRDRACDGGVTQSGHSASRRRRNCGRSPLVDGYYYPSTYTSTTQTPYLLALHDVTTHFNNVAFIRTITSNANHPICSIIKKNYQNTNFSCLFHIIFFQMQISY